MIASATQKKPIALSRLRAVPLRRVRGRFDSAATTDDNRRHWANADALSADAAASAAVRRTLRNRARYEVANNSYARGIVLTLANDTIGTGPRLQMLTGSDEANDEIEHEFDRWAHEISLAEKLRTMRMARAQDGEAFAILVNNPVLDHPVKLDLRLIEADQVASPAFGGQADRLLDRSTVRRRDLASPNRLTVQQPNSLVDGIVLDAYGNPVAYHVLKNHPGNSAWGFNDEYRTVPASHVIHVFRQDRPGQHRGIPEITPALPLFAQLRRFTLAVLGAAEAAADFAGILYTDAPANGEAEQVEPMDLVELERNMLLTMPGGWKMSQVEPMQPATTYAEFKKEILNEIARCLNMPYNVAAGNSSGYNYASGRLDHQTYYKSIRVDQAFMAEKVLDRVLAAWLWEYALEAGGQFVFDLPDRQAGSAGPLGGRVLPDHQWFWDGMEHVDPAKEASAQETRLKNHTTTLAHEYSKQGRDWQDALRQRGKEVALMRELGLTDASAKPAAGLPAHEPEDLSPEEMEEAAHALSD